MIRPRTVLRLIVYVGLSWLVLAALYAGLPSFSRTDNGTNYATKVLQSGRKLTRVYGTDDYFKKHDTVDFPGNNEQRISLALSFQIDAVSNKLIISDMGEVSLTKPEEWVTENQLKNEDEEDDVFLLETPVLVSAPAGDDDGINLPWFDTADAVLMFHFVHRDYASVRLRVAWKDNGHKVEVWPDTNRSIADHSFPLISLTLKKDEDSSGQRIITASVPPPPLSLSPSATYHIRLTLLAVLAPFTILIMGILPVISSAIYMTLSFLFKLFWVVLFVLVARWLYECRPPVDDFVQGVVDDAQSISESVRKSLGRWKSGDRKDEEHIPVRNSNASPEEDKKT